MPVRSVSCDGVGTASYDLLTVEIGNTTTDTSITIRYAPIEPRHAIAVTVIAGDDRHQVVAELFEDDTFVVRIQDLVASDSEFVGGTQQVDDRSMRILVPDSTLDIAALRNTTAVELVVDGVFIETCELG